MKDIRNLLLDCRTALRRADKHFEDSPLADQLGDAIIRISREHEPPPPSEAAVAKPHAQRIAYAWQAAARELRATHPEVHALLSKRVFERLGEDVLDDAEDEIETLRGHLRLREAANAKLAQELAAAKAAVAVPVAAPPPMAATGAGLPASLPGAPFATLQEEDPHVPSHTLLQSVAEGKATLTENHRDWCVAEAMVLTGFERTPVQLAAEGDAALAARVLAGMPAGG